MKVFIGLFQPVYASEWGDCVDKAIGNVPTIQCLEPIFGRVVQATLALSGVALFVMLVVGGYNFLLSGGDQKKLEAARGTLTNAVIGLVVIVLAFLIVRTIELFTGATGITQFTIPAWKP
ncbi:hypothetical protein HY032_00645 [Candidatus Gottesmanbacteria bacterium]|nr:hypothetical protein [Candidatus Gottesmanbacteria bacterium]